MGSQIALNTRTLAWPISMQNCSQVADHSIASLLRAQSCLLTPLLFAIAKLYKYDSIPCFALDRKMWLHMTFHIAYETVSASMN